MGYGDQGQCPMLVDSECSIYEDRPQTCRDYDCRVFAATGLSVDEDSQPEIACRVRAWRFRYEEEDHALQAVLRRALTFLQDNRDRFPAGSLPSQPGPLAAIALQIYKLFATAETHLADASIIERIMAVLREKMAPLESGSRLKRSNNKGSASR